MAHIYVSIDNISLNDYKEVVKYDYEIEDHVTVLSDEKVKTDSSNVSLKNVKNILVMEKKNIEKKCTLLIIGRIYNFSDEDILDMFKKNKLDEINLQIMDILGSFAIILVETSSTVNNIACFVDFAGSIKLYADSKYKTISTDETIGKKIPRGCKCICGIYTNRKYKNISKIYTVRPLDSLFPDPHMIKDKSLVNIFRETINSNLISYSQYDVFIVGDMSKLYNQYCIKILKTFFGGKIIYNTDNKEKAINISFYPLDLLFFKTKKKATSMSNSSEIKEKYNSIINGDSSFKISENTVYPLLNWNIFELVSMMKIEERNFETIFDS